MRRWPMTIVLCEVVAVSTALPAWSAGQATPGQYEAELVFPLHSQHNHAPGIVECPNGDLLVSWYRGSGERSADDVAVYGARRRKGSAQWSEPFLLSTVDIIKRHICPDRPDAFYLRMGKITSVGAAVAMIAGAIAIAHLPKESMVDLNLKIIQIVFGGGLMGLFLLGFLTTRVNYISASVALVLTLLLDIYLALCSFNQLPECISVRVHTYWIGVIANGFVIFVGYAMSFITPGAPKPLGRLTIWTMKDQRCASGLVSQHGSHASSTD